jgi:predicted nucleic acid-binding protein
MTARRATYVDSSALVKLVVPEPESAALRAFLRRRRPLIASALARVEVARAVLPLGAPGLRAGRAALSRVTLVRVNDRVLDSAASLLPAELRALDAIHVATAHELRHRLAQLVTYDARMAAAATNLGLRVVAPS